MEVWGGWGEGRWVRGGWEMGDWVEGRMGRGAAAIETADPK